MCATPENLLTQASITVEEGAGVGFAFTLCRPDAATSAIAANANFFQFFLIDRVFIVFIEESPSIEPREFRTRRVPWFGVGFAFRRQ